MKHTVILAFIFIIETSGFAQIYPDKYLIEFTDKNNSPFSIENPAEFLSQRALDRRERYGVPIDEIDLPVNPQYLQELANIGVQIINPTKWLNAVSIYTTDPAKLAEIQALPFVKSVMKCASEPPQKSEFEDSDKLSLHKPFGINEYYEVLKTRLKSTNSITSLDYGMGFNQIEMIGGIGLHDQGYQGQGMVIAVLDGGFTATNELDAFDSLYINGQILGTRDFVGGGTNVYQGSGHGTAVLSTMGANLPGQLIGTAPKASYWLLRTEDTGSEYIIEEFNWASGAEFADSVGADIINSSLSYKTFDDPLYNHSYENMDGNTAPSTKAADIASSRGMVVVNSAGNDGNSSTWPYIGAPADADSVFSIGAVDPDGIYASFSSIGPTYDGRLKPNFVAQGKNTVIASLNGGIGTSSGTSFSSPIIAGMTACLWQTDPTMTNMNLLNAIETSSSLATNPDYQMGHGIPDYTMASIILSGFNPDLVKEKNQIDIFPNPFESDLKIVYNSPDTHNVSIRIFDIEGRLLYSRDNIYRRVGLNYFHLTGLEDFRQGVYFLTIAAKEIISTQKIVKF
jgi:hypothetical protein